MRRAPSILGRLVFSPDAPWADIADFSASLTIEPCCVWDCWCPRRGDSASSGVSLFVFVGYLMRLFLFTFIYDIATFGGH